MDLSSQMGKEIRLSKFLDPSGRAAIVVKADQGLALGPVPGLEEMASGLGAIVSAGVDAVILSPGQAAKQAHLFKGRRAPALLVRSDWSNVARTQSFPLPWKRMTHVAVAGAKHAAFLGAHGLVASFYVGYKDDEDEADNLQSVSQLAAECLQYGLPLLVEALPLGERITEQNYLDSLKMAGRMSLEVGADGIIVPYAGSERSMRDVVEAAGAAPVLLLLSGVKDGEGISESVRAGVKGVVIEATGLGEDVGPSIAGLSRLLGRGG